MVSVLDFEAYVVQANAYIASRYDGDQRKAFDAFADPDGKVSRDGVIRFLTDAGIGLRIFRYALANYAVSILDTDGDGKVSWDELQAKHPANAVADSGDVDDVVARDNLRALRHWKVGVEAEVAAMKAAGLDGAARVIQGILDKLTV